MKMPSNLVPCTLVHLIYLCQQMRADEIEQYLALTGADRFDPDVCAVGMFQLNGPRFTVVDENNMPIVSGGYSEVLPGVWNSWMVGTSAGWQKHWISITKATKWLVYFMFNNMGARRLETQGLTSRNDACWWYEKSLGMVYEGTRVGLGVNGEDVSFYGRVRPAEVANG